MAGCSKKQYAIMMSSGPEGEQLASKMGSMEQEEFNQAFAELIESDAATEAVASAEASGEKPSKWSKEDDEDYGDFDPDSDDDYGFDEDDEEANYMDGVAEDRKYEQDRAIDIIESSDYFKDGKITAEDYEKLYVEIKDEVNPEYDDIDDIIEDYMESKGYQYIKPDEKDKDEEISKERMELSDEDIANMEKAYEIDNPSLKKSPKNDPRWKEMIDEYDAGKDLSVLENWVYRRPWEASKETFERILSDENPYNTPRKEFFNKYKDLIGSIIDYDTQRNNEYRDYLGSDEYKQSRLVDLLDESDLGLEDFQDKYKKAFNSKYGYEETEPFYIHDLDTDLNPDEDYKRFKEAQEIEKTQGRDAANRYMNNRRINKKETLKRLIGNGEITIDELVNFLKGKK